MLVPLTWGVHALIAPISARVAPKLRMVSDTPEAISAGLRPRNDSDHPLVASAAAEADSSAAVNPGATAFALRPRNDSDHPLVASAAAEADSSAAANPGATAFALRPRNDSDHPLVASAAAEADSSAAEPRRMSADVVADGAAASIDARPALTASALEAGPSSTRRPGSSRTTCIDPDVMVDDPVSGACRATV